MSQCADDEPLPFGGRELGAGYEHLPRGLRQFIPMTPAPFGYVGWLAHKGALIHSPDWFAVLQ